MRGSTKRGWQLPVIAVLAVAIAIIVAFATCGNDDDDRPPPDSTATTTTSAPTKPPTQPTPPPPTATITSPGAGESIERETQLTGTVSHLPSGHKLWIVVQIGVYYPQDGPLNVLPDGRWTAAAFVGGVDDANRAMVIHVVETGPEGTAQFTQYLETGRTTGRFPGIQQALLASDVTFLNFVNVTRR